MQIIKEIYKLEKISKATEKYFSEDTLLFDIECTGLSPRSHFIYLIGFATRTNDNVTVTQLFAEDIDDEKNILLKFEEYLDQYKNLAGFNSTRFDESFILERCKKHGIVSNIKSCFHFDIYLTSTKSKCLLDLPNYKQKTFEEYLGLIRDDKYNGGELIPIYEDYVINHSSSSKDLVLLHNAEDIKGMVYILDILNYVDLLNADLTFQSSEDDSDYFRFYLKSTVAIPVPINKKRDYGFYLIKDDIYTCGLSVFEGTLFTFLDDYRNYYYLLNEGIIIPKSIGQAISKESRRNATKKDCKVAKEGKFVRLPDKMKLAAKYHIFKTDYDSKESYLLIDDISDGLLIEIARFMLKH